MHKLAIYDMDKTLTRAATWTPFLIHAARMRAPWRLALLPVAGLATLAYGAKLIDRSKLKQVTQRLMLGRATSPADMTALAEAFTDTVDRDGVFGQARERIAADRAAGYRLVLATASYRYYAAVIGTRLGFADVIATGTAVDDRGHWLARIDGDNCYGPSKLTKIEAWLKTEGIARDDAHVRFYSDHVSDAPVLAWADEPFAVNAHGPLRAMAKVEGWPIIDWEH
jgi:HAD superfamily hydrolase (TIGR01490 family)